MRQFHVRVGLGTMLDEVDLLFGGIIFTTALASLQGLHADNRLIDFDGAQLTLINHLDNVRRAEVGAGAASHAAVRHRHHLQAAALLDHLQRLLAHDLLADANAQPAADTPVGRRRQRDILLLRQIVQALGLGCHLNQALERLDAGLLNRLARGADDHALFDPEHATEHDQTASAPTLDLDGAQLATARWFEGGIRFEFLYERMKKFQGEIGFRPISSADTGSITRQEF